MGFKPPRSVKLTLVLAGAWAGVGPAAEYSRQRLSLQRFAWGFNAKVWFGGGPVGRPAAVCVHVVLPTKGGLHR